MRMSVCVSLVVLIVVAGCGQGQPCTSPTGRSIAVVGTSKVRLDPDRVSFTVGVETTHASVSEAFRLNTGKVGAVLSGLKAAGVAAEEIQTSYFDISTLHDEPTRRRVYRVVNNITVTRDDTASVANLLEIAVKAGANQAGGVRFLVSDPAAARARGLELAFQDARVKAQSMADLSGATLGDVVCATDERSESSPLQFHRQSLAYGGGGFIEPGTEELAFNVSVVFELR